MLTFCNVNSLDGSQKTLKIQSEHTVEIPAEHLLALPALIDPHVHFRTPGAEHKENWISGARAAISGGVTTVFDMPNNTPSCTSLQRLQEKIARIEEQLIEANIPLRYHLYFGAHKGCVPHLEMIKNKVIGIKVYMGSSTGTLLLDDPQALDELFAAAAQYDLLIAVHAECESILSQRTKLFKNESDPKVHSSIRDRSAAITATEHALLLAEKYRTRLGILHLSTKEELQLVKEAKGKALPVFAEVSPHHLFLHQPDYQKWGTFVQMNPPIREKEDLTLLWNGLLDGSIDTIGTDHAPHTLKEKQQPYGKAPSGIPGIETYLPLLLSAHLPLDRLVQLTRTNIEKLYRLEPNDDLVLINLKHAKQVDASTFQSKCKWSPFDGHMLTGWPEYVVIKGKGYQVGLGKPKLLTQELTSSKAVQ